MQHVRLPMIDAMGRERATAACARALAVCAALAVCMLVAAAAAGAATLHERVAGHVARSGIAAQSSVVVYDVAAQTVIYRHRPRTPVVPASNQKLYTAAALLATLGPDYRFTTRLALRGVQHGARFDGNVYLVGGGDPTLSTAAFARRNFGGRGANIALLAKALQAKGIKRVTGKLVVDDSFLDRRRYVLAWPAFFRFDEAPALGGLTVNHGYYGSKLDGPSTRVPDIWAGQVLRAQLRARGIVVEGRTVSARMPADAKVAGELLSPPLHRILRFMNRTSDNFTAEVLLKDLGRIVTGRGTTIHGALAGVRALRQLGVDVSRVRFADGSGLAATNRTTADDLATLINVVDRNPQFGDEFVEELAVNGLEGTLRRRLTRPGVRLRVRAKTGTLHQTSALTGFATRADGRRYGFSVVTYVPGARINYARARALQDAVAATLVR